MKMKKQTKKNNSDNQKQRFENVDPLEDLTPKQKRIRERIRLAGWTRDDLIHLVISCSVSLKLKRAPTAEEYKKWIDHNLYLYPYPNQFYMFGVYFERAQEQVDKTINSKKIRKQNNNIEDKNSNRNEQKTAPKLIRKYFSKMTEKYLYFDRKLEKIHNITSLNDVIEMLLFHVDMEGFIPSVRRWDIFAKKYNLPSSYELMKQTKMVWWTDIVKHALVKTNNIIEKNPHLVWNIWYNLSKMYLKDRKHNPSVSNLHSWVNKHTDMFVPNKFYSIVRKEMYGDKYI